MADRLTGQKFNELGHDVGPEIDGSLDELNVSLGSRLQTPWAWLAFAKGPHDFEAPDRGVGGPEGLEAQRRFDQSLELAVVGLDHVVQVRDLTMLSVRRAL